MPVYKLIIIDHLAGSSAVKPDRITDFFSSEKLQHLRIRDRSVELQQKKLSVLLLREYRQGSAVGMVVDYLLTSVLSNVGINLPINYCFGLMVTVWLIINELISILENLDRIGIPLPGFLVKVVNKLKNRIDEETEEL